VHLRGRWVDVCVRVCVCVYYPFLVDASLMVLLVDERCALSVFVLLHSLCLCCCTLCVCVAALSVFVLLHSLCLCCCALCVCVAALFVFVLLLCSW